MKLILYKILSSTSIASIFLITGSLIATFINYETREVERGICLINCMYVCVYPARFKTLLLMIKCMSIYPGSLTRTLNIKGASAYFITYF